MNRQVSSDDFQPTMQTYGWGRFLATQKGRKLVKTVNSFKVTILCGLITFLVLRGTMQAGSTLPDSTMDSDVELVRGRSPARARMLTQVEGDDTDAVGEEVTSNESSQQKWDPNKTYTLGPKISNWDGQRRSETTSTLAGTYLVMESRRHCSFRALSLVLVATPRATSTTLSF